MRNVQYEMLSSGHLAWAKTRFCYSAFLLGELLSVETLTESFVALNAKLSAVGAMRARWTMYEFAVLWVLVGLWAMYTAIHSTEYVRYGIFYRWLLVLLQFDSTELTKWSTNESFVAVAIALRLWLLMSHLFCAITMISAHFFSLSLSFPSFRICFYFCSVLPSISILFNICIFLYLCRQFHSPHSSRSFG